MRKPERCTSLSEGQGEYREAGSRNFSLPAGRQASGKIFVTESSLFYLEVGNTPL
jgi:hypothetical protein